MSRKRKDQEKNKAFIGRSPVKPLDFYISLKDSQPQGNILLHKKLANNQQHHGKLIFTS